jgi:hypothetical protein
MKSRRRPILIALAVLLAGGGVRLHWEDGATKQFRRDGLLSEPLDIDVREKIGQNSAVVALAGLRTLVASFASLRATEQFTNTEWPELDESVNTTVQLSPKTGYYWDIGGWHLAYNAAAFYRNDPNLSSLRAQAEARRWVEKGRQFFERGTRNNPDNWRLAAALGNLYSSSYHFPDDEKAVSAYARAWATGKADPRVRRNLLQARARTGEDPAVLLAELRDILKSDPSSAVPSMLALRYVLEAKMTPPEDPVARAVAIFGSEERALRILGAYFTDYLDRMPQTGVETVIRLLEGRAGVAPDSRKSYIRQRKELSARNLGFGR